MIAQDSCADAMPVTEGLYTVPEVNGSEVPLPVCATGGGGSTAGMWYLYTTPEDKSVTVTTDLPGTGGVDTRLHVHTGLCGELECVAGDDDGGSGLTSLLTFEAEADVVYYISFDNRWTSAGFDFQIIENDPGQTPMGFTFMSLSTIGASVGAVDMNGDFLDDVVSTSSTEIRISYQQPDGTFETVDHETGPVQFTASWSLTAGDIDGNGYNDLMYGNGQGVAFLFANEDGTGYTPTEFPQYVFSQRGNMVDINNDGHLDAFMCHDVAPNVFYINDGEGNLTFNQGGMGDTPNGGNYGSIFVDYDNDCLPDLFIAKCKGAGSPASVNQMHRNNGDGTFTEVAEEIGLADGIQTWSSAWADFNNDGYLDVFVGASSFSAGGHKLMMNNGDGTFTDVTEGSGFDTFNSTSIEWITHDFNNDGYADIMGAGNWVWLNNGDFTFTQAPVNVANGAVGDMNNDGFLDIVRSNGIYYNNGNSNNWIKIITVGTVSNSGGIGARVEVTSALGTQMRDVRAGDGFKFASSLTTHFGIGQDTEIEKISICWPSGITTEVEFPDINTTITMIEEDISTEVEEMATPDSFRIFPNPTNNFLNIVSPNPDENLFVRVFDLSGKVVLHKGMTGQMLDVSPLISGMYILQIERNNEVSNHRFVKY
ncbi:MAG: T9SS C-terminal target domain-containing protein [Cryomorphaceae bacterium]|nr:MAG: T9SS C-terminal target domain-containing protein [Cryomorphaceae bacterium]